MAAVVVAVTAAASAEAVAFVAAALAVAFAVVAFAVAGFTVLLTAVAFVAAAFMMVAFAAVGSTIAASTIGSSSLVILGTRSFTIPIHTTGTIPIAIILAIILMVTDTAALPTAVFVAAAFVAVAFAAVGDPYNEPVYQGSAGYTDQLVGQIQLRLARAGYYNGLIDGVSGNATRRAIVNMSYERAHSLPADGQIRGRLLTTMGLG
jgi:Putative peptidoglycan binding domain